jgi:hypothetical protein
MAITEGSVLQISVTGQQNGQTIMNVWQFLVTGTFSGISAGAVANAFWQATKSTYRAIAPAGYLLAFQKVFVEDISESLGDYGEYAVPTSEQPGTRDTGSSEGMPTFNAVGVKMVVATRVTRPGQKRFAYMTEQDSVSGAVSSTLVTAVDNLMNTMVGGLVLPSPALGMDLLAVVCKKDPATGDLITQQQVVSWLINPAVTSQVSRKSGRGI